VEFKLGSSTSVVCPFCRASVIRTDRDLQAIGRIADLVPTSPAMVVGDRGLVDGEEFVVGGRLQLDHGRGPWDEWYVEMTRTGKWAWLAQAQGKFYITSLVQTGGLPPVMAMSPGAAGALAGTDATVWTVTERGSSTLLSAEGELPYPAVQGETGRYVDVVSPGGGFGTIDYGDGSEPAKFFAGREIPHDAIQWTKSALGPRAEQQVDLGKLSCPTCGAPVELQVPDSAQRAGCTHCFSVLDFERGNLRLLAQQGEPPLRPLIPFGAKGTLFDLEHTCIGYMVRETVAYGITYRWREYLFYTPSGFRWLMEDKGHWTHFETVSAAEVQRSGASLRFGGRSHRYFATNRLKVRYVLGEFYWKVQVGDEVSSTDYIAPPYLLSEESTGSELIYSKGHYLEGAAIWKAFGLEGEPPPSRDVAPAQPNPHSIAMPALITIAAFVLLCALGGLLEFGRSHQVLVDGPLQVPMLAGEPTAATNTAVFTPPFTIPNGPTTMEIELGTSVDNQWLGVAGSLIDEGRGTTTDFFVDAGYYHGVSGGESWSEGSRSASAYLGSIPGGTYVMRLDPQWQNHPQPGAYGTGLVAPSATIRVTEGSRNPFCFLFSLFLLVIPLSLKALRRHLFEKRRAESA